MENASGFKGYESIFAKRFRELMETPPKTSQAELAKHTGWTRQAISQYRDGTILPNVERLHIICSYFDVPSDYLLGLTDSKSKDVTDQYIQDTLGLSKEAIESVKKVYRKRFRYDVESPPHYIDFVNYLLANPKFMERYPEQMNTYFNNRYDDSETQTSDDTKVSKYWVINIYEELVEGCYNDFIKLFHANKKGKRKPAKKSEKTISKIENTED